MRRHSTTLQTQESGCISIWEGQRTSCRRIVALAHQRSSLKRLCAAPRLRETRLNRAVTWKQTRSSPSTVRARNRSGGPTSGGTRTCVIYRILHSRLDFRDPIDIVLRDSFPLGVQKLPLLSSAMCAIHQSNSSARRPKLRDMLEALEGRAIFKASSWSRGPTSIR